MAQTPMQALDGVPNAGEFLPTLFGGGQPGAANLRGLKEAGIEIVLDLREPMEPRPIDEPALVRELGMEYVNVPVSAGTLTDATMERILTVLREAGNRPVYCHCAGGSRVGGALIPYAMIDQGLGEEEAIAQAMRVGLRSAEMMDWGLDYAKRNTKPTP